MAGTVLTEVQRRRPSRSVRRRFENRAGPSIRPPLEPRPRFPAILSLLADLVVTVTSRDPFNRQNALAAALVLEEVLADRKHVKRVHGIEFETPGTLGNAIGVPRIVSMLRHRSAARQDEGLAALRTLWATLSERTRGKVLESLGWYDPRELDWDDPRSNRYPLVSDDK